MRYGRCVSRLIPSVVIGAAALLPAAPGHAQGNERALPVRPFALIDADGWIEFEYQYEADESTGRGGRDRETIRSEIAEEIQVNTRSYIYHPYVVDLQLDAGLRAEQGRTEHSPRGLGDGGAEAALTDNVRADVTIAKRKPLVSHLFYHRLLEDQAGGAQTHTTAARGFELNTTSYGGDLTYGRGMWPASLHVARTLTEGVGAVATDEDELNALFTLDNDGRRLDTHLTLRYDDREDQFRSTTAEAITGTLRHGLTFGSADQHRWNSEFRYFTESGTTARDQLDVREAVTYQFDDRWRARSTGTYQDVALPDDSLRTWTGLGEVSHQLHGSLHSRAQIRTYQSESMQSETTETEGLLGFRYRKRVPGGLLTAGLRVSQSYTREDAASSRYVVNDESHTFVTGVPVLLDNPDVDTSTVVVTDSTGVITYIQGIDYLLLARNTLTEMVRLISGSIPLGGTVLVDYEFRVGEELELESFSIGTNARLNLWQWLSLYGRYETTDRTVTAGVDPTGRAEDSHGWLLGLEAQHRDLTVVTEFERSDSGLSAYDRTSVRVHYTDTLFGQWNGFGTAAWALTAFENPAQDVTSVDLRLGLQGAISRWGHAEVDAWLRTESGRVGAEDSTAAGIRALFDWSYRKVNGRVQYVHVLEDDAGGQHQERDEFLVSIRRRF